MTFCATCIEESDDLVIVYLTERPVLLCPRCRDEHPRSGRWTFDAGDREPTRFSPGLAAQSSQRRKKPR